MNTSLFAFNVYRDSKFPMLCRTGVQRFSDNLITFAFASENIAQQLGLPNPSDCKLVAREKPYPSLSSKDLHMVSPMKATSPKPLLSHQKSKVNLSLSVFLSNA